jgi:hypothetical protein
MAVSRRCVKSSSEIVHAFGGGERAPAPGAISASIEPLGARHSRREGCLGALLSAFDRAGRRLAIEVRQSIAAPLVLRPDCFQIGAQAFSNCAILLVQGPACADAEGPHQRLEVRQIVGS